MRGFCFFILLSLTGATATFPQVTPSRAEPVWFWFSDCQNGKIMGVNVVVDGRTVYRSRFRTCQIERTNATTEKQHDKKTFRFSGGHTFQNTHPTSNAESVEGNIWQAGAETDGILLGISFVAHDQVLLNTMHLVKPGKSTQSTLDRGVVIETYPTANTQQKAAPPECTKVPRVHGSFPQGPFKTLPTESYKNAPSVKFLIQEDGSVSETSITRSSGVADIDKQVLEAISQWKYKPRPAGCGVIENQMTVIIHWGDSH